MYIFSLLLHFIVLYNYVSVLPSGVIKIDW